MYNFDKLINRRNTGSIKWDVKENELPMWVADMDFETAPCIKEALQKTVDFGVFGYTDITREWREAYMSWWDRRHHATINKEWLVYSAGVIPTISSTIRKLTTPGEKILIQTPVYNIFYNSILNNGRNVLESELIYDGNEYHIDFEDLENKLSDPQVSLMILCNPQNPAGKIWDKETLARIGELCKEYGVIVLSDEVHCDLVDPGKEYVPFFSVSDTCREISITAIAPTKAFNIAGIQTSAVVIPDKVLRHKVWRALNTDEVGEPNVFAVNTAIAAFNNGEEWLNELNKYVYDNKTYVREFIKNNLPNVKVVPSEATYLLWLDVSHYTDDSKKFAKDIRALTGLYLSNGVQYGGDGNKFLRLNTATQRVNIEDGMNRLKKAIELLQSE